jgi:hypothetical protein
VGAAVRLLVLVWVNDKEDEDEEPMLVGHGALGSYRSCGR